MNKANEKCRRSEASPIFTVAWAYPPIASGESIVCERSLKYSKYSYHVVSGRQQGRKRLQNKKGNVSQTAIPGEKYFLWVYRAWRRFQKMNRNFDYNVLYSRVMPVNGHLAGLLIKLYKPSIKWIVYFSDPVWNSPFVKIKNYLRVKEMRPPNFWLMKLYGLSSLLAIKMSSLLVFNNDRLARYILGKQYDRYADKIVITPYGYEKMQHEDQKNRGTGLLRIAHVGQVYGNRNFKLLVEALRIIRGKYPTILSHICFTQVGFLNEADRAAIQTNGFSDLFDLYDTVSYEESLTFMREADMLLVLDPQFDRPDQNIFVPSKIFDYMSVGRPILAITDPGSVTASIAEDIHCKRISHEATAIAQAFVDLVEKGAPVCDKAAYERYSCKRGIDILDEAIANL